MLFSIAFLLGFVGMEAASWAIHKYLMHGPLWSVHKTHHLPQKGHIELNDIFSLSFGLCAAWAIYDGLSHGNVWEAGIGLGVTFYGIVYFVLHDLAIHNRLKIRWLSRLTAFERLRKAHKIHHKSLSRKPARAFGLLFVLPSVFHSAED